MKRLRVRSTKDIRVIFNRITTRPNAASILGIIAAAWMIGVGVKDQLLLRREGAAAMKTFFHHHLEIHKLPVDK